MEEKTKKKSIYLMLVGALTLLVLVGTATFAYFQISVNGTSTNTTLNTNVESGIGVFKIEGGGESLRLNLTIDNMANTDTAKHAYEATTTGGANTAHVGTLSKTVANLGRTYTCDFDVVASASINKTIQATDNSKFVISSASPNVTFSDDGGVSYKSTIEKPWTVLSSQQTYKGKWISGLDDAETAYVDVQASIENINGNQNHLAGLNGSLNFKLQSMTCTSNSNVTATRGNSPIKVTLSNVTNESTLRTNLPSTLTQDQKDNAKLVEVTVPSGSGNVEITIDVSGFAKEGETVVLYHYNGSTYDPEQTTTVKDGKVTGIFSSLSPIALVNIGIKPTIHDNDNFSIIGKVGGGACDISNPDGCEVKLSKDGIEQYFYVFGNPDTNGKVKLLAKYNLYVGHVYDSDGNKVRDIVESDEKYLLQDSSALGWVNGASQYVGTTEFSDEDSEYSTSIVKDYVRGYINKLNYIYGLNLYCSEEDAYACDGTLLTYEEMDEINTEGHWYQNNNVPKTSFRSSSPSGYIYVWNLYSDGYLDYYGYDDDFSFGVRPVILVDWS